MPSLIDQMNILKGLSDQSLATELQTPSGAVPPYLVMGEMNRRKDMRQRYAGQMAQRQPQTTVAQDLIASAPPPPGAAAGPGAPMAQVGSMPGAPMAPAGIAAAAGAPRGYAGGGIVDYASPDYSYSPGDTLQSGVAYAPQLDPGYAGITSKYSDLLAQEQKDRAQAPWLGLLDAGLATAAGTSPYALSNIGAGGQAGLASYAANVKGIDANTAGDLAQLAQIQQAKQQQDQTAQSFALEQQKFAASQDPNSPQNVPPAIREANLVNAMPEDTPDEIAAKQNAMKIITPFAAQNADNKAAIADTIADGAAVGKIDPSLGGQYSMKQLIEASLLKNHPGLNLAQMQQQWAAAQANMKNMNSSQQLRLRQVIGEVAGQNGQPGMLDKLQSVADDWNGSGLPALNGVNLAAALQGAYGEPGIEKATQFKAQLAEVAPALGTVFSNGNALTDKALDNALSIFDKDTSKNAFDKLIGLVKFNVGVREDALNQAPAPTGAGPNPYNFSGATTPTGTPGAPTANVPWSVVGP